MEQIEKSRLQLLKTLQVECVTSAFRIQPQRCRAMIWYGRGVGKFKQRHGHNATHWSKHSRRTTTTAHWRTWVEKGSWFITLFFNHKCSSPGAFRRSVRRLHRPSSSEGLSSVCIECMRGTREGRISPFAIRAASTWIIPMQVLRLCRGKAAWIVLCREVRDNGMNGSQSWFGLDFFPLKRVMEQELWVLFQSW